MEILDRNGIRDGLVVDLGCGSGLWARELVDAGYEVLGIDISGAMIELSRNRVPEAEFRVGSLFEVEIPSCNAVTAVSEVLNYLFDAENEERGLGRLFQRVHDALVPAASSSSTCWVRDKCRLAPERKVSALERIGQYSPSLRRTSSGVRWSAGS
jgi:SAM-dependent methyltransferase